MIGRLQQKWKDLQKKRQNIRIYGAGKKKQMLEMTYRDKAGNESKRTVEPYKLDNKDFWGFDPEKDSIRRFKTDRITKVKPINQTFTPRWEIEMNKVAMYREQINKEAAFKLEKMVYKLTPKGMKAMKEYGIDPEDLRPRPANVRPNPFQKQASKQELPDIKKALKSQMQQNIATMMATSHEYKNPAVDEALALVKNYKWEKSTAKVSDLQGLDKPTDLKKVRDMAEAFKGKAIKPLITVDKLHGIKPQTKGKRILLDGHHRLKAAEYLGRETVPIYKGTFTGKAQQTRKELREKS